MTMKILKTPYLGVLRFTITKKDSKIKTEHKIPCEVRLETYKIENRAACIPHTAIPEDGLVSVMNFGVLFMDYLFDPDVLSVLEDKEVIPSKGAATMNDTLAIVVRDRLSFLCHNNFMQDNKTGELIVKIQGNSENELQSRAKITFNIIKQQLQDLLIEISQKLAEDKIKGMMNSKEV